MPSKLVVPKYEYTEVQDCLAACAVGGLNPFPWQAKVLEGWLGRNILGRWSAQTCGLPVPRQNGKTLGTAEARMNYGMLILGEEIIYTAHLQKTATETFEDMANFFDCKALRKHVKDIKTALGREQIILNNGARVKFLARTRNGGRGQHGDLLVYDEGQELTDEQHGSFLPAISASPNPQTIFMLTPPDENAPGEVVRRIRDNALSGESSTIAWAEFSVDEIGDVHDRDRWYATNPSLGITIQESTIAAECEQMSPDRFARERLGWWSKREKVIEPVIKANAWDACKTDTPPDDGLLTCAVKFTPDGSTGALAVCLRPKDGVPYIEVIDSRSMSGGVKWFADWIYERRDKLATVAIDGRSNASALINRLNDMGMPQKAIVSPGTNDITTACSMLVDAVASKDIEHYGQPALDASATLTSKRKIGSAGGFGFESTEKGDASLIEACALAFWQAKTTKRRPGRKAVVY